jgi:hypothetical protein
MRVNRFVLPIVMMVALLGTALVAQAAGLWSTSGRDATNLANMTPADVKGWMTLQQVMDGIGIAQAELYPLASIPMEVPPSTALKDLEPLVPDFSVTTLRDKLTAWASASNPPASSLSAPAAGGTAAAGGTPEPAGATPVPPESSGATATPQPAAAVTTAPLASPTHVAGSGDGTGTGPTPLPAGQILPANQIKGKLTLQQVSDQCAVPLEALLTELGLPATTNPNTALKDLVSQGALTEVTQVQTAVAKLQGK